MSPAGPAGGSASPSSAPQLDEAYERLHAWGPEWGGDDEGNNGLTNHGPMAAEVMARRGFGDLVPSWVASYVPRLEPLPAATDRITRANWRGALGDGRRVGDWTAYLGDELAHRPWRDVLAEWWPRLLPGIAAGATHGVIRVSHAVRALAAGDMSAPAVAELAHGLAFWAARSRVLPGAAPPSGDRSPAEALAGIPHLPEQSGLLAHRLARLADVPGWPAAQGALRRPLDDAEVVSTLEALVDAATLRYLGRGHGSPVLLVHTATAPNAVLHTLPHLPREVWGASLAAAWSASAAIVAAYDPTYAVPRDELPEAPAAVDQVAAAIERSMEHGDEHVIKFTDTAAEVFERSGDPDALAAAARVAELIAPR